MAVFSALPITGRLGRKGSFLQGTVFGHKDSGTFFNLDNVSGKYDGFRPHFMGINANQCLRPFTVNYQSTSGVGISFQVDPLNNSFRVVEVPCFDVGAQFNIIFNVVDQQQSNNVNVFFYDVDATLSNFTPQISAIANFNIIEITNGTVSPANIPEPFQWTSYVMISVQNGSASSWEGDLTFGAQNSLGNGIVIFLSAAAGATSNFIVFNGGATALLDIGGGILFGSIPTGISIVVNIGTNISLT